MKPLALCLDWVRKIVNWGVTSKDPLRDPSHTKRIRFINMISLGCGLVGPVSLPFDWWAAPRWMIAEDIATPLLFGLVLLANKRGKTHSARIAFLLIANLVIVVNALLLGMSAGIFCCFFGLAAFAFMVFDRNEKWSLGCALFVPVALCVFFIATDFTVGHFRQSPEKAHLYFVYSALVSFTMTGLSVSFLQKTNFEAEQALRTSRAQAMHSEKMAALGEMSSGLAHEINTPLTALQLNALLLKKLLKSGGTTPEKIQLHLDKIERMVERVTRVTHALQTFSRSGELDPMTRTSVSSIIHDTLELCLEKFRSHGVQILIDEGPGDLTLECRGVQISQVLLNLLNNAFHAVAPLPVKWIDIRVTSAGRHFHLRVTDSGTGIAPALREKIFEPFFTTKVSGQGTGLGLSISRGIVEKHHGRLYVDPASSHTCFVMEFAKPAVASSPPSSLSSV